jgi:hypothetical protein
MFNEYPYLLLASPIQYEDRLNPFSRFKHREASAGISNLPPSDRAVLAGGQLLAGSK